jgi:hypothetical protein
MLQMIPLIDKLNDFVGIANSEWGSLSSITKGFNLQAETASAMLVRMWNNVKLVAVAAGTALLPVIKGLTLGVSNLALGLRDWMEQRPEFFTRWGERIGEFLESLSTLQSRWSDWVLLSTEVGSGFYMQAMDNVTALGSNALKVLSNLVRAGASLVRAYLGQIPALIQNAVNKTLAGLPPGILRFLGLLPGAQVAVPKVDPGRILNANVIGAGMQPLPGFHAPWNDPKMLAGVAGANIRAEVEALRGKRADEQAKGFIKDWLTRVLQSLAADRPDPVARKEMGRILGAEAAEGQAPPHFALGGRPRPGEPALVGERGPELFVPDRPGRVVPDIEKIRAQLEELKRLRAKTEEVMRRAAAERAAGRMEALANLTALQRGRMANKFGVGAPNAGAGFVDPTLGVGAAMHAANATRTAELMGIGRPARATLNAPAGNANTAPLHPFAPAAAGAAMPMVAGRSPAMDQALVALARIRAGQGGPRRSASMEAARRMMNNLPVMADSPEMQRAKAALAAVRGGGGPPQDAAHMLLARIQGERAGANPPAAPVGWSGRRALGAGLGMMGGLPGIVGAGIGIAAGSGARARRLELQAWRQRVGARGGRHRGPTPIERIYAAQREAQARRRQQMFIATGGPAALRARQRHQEALRRHHEPPVEKGKDWRDDGKDIATTLAAILDRLNKMSALPLWGK